MRSMSLFPILLVAAGLAEAQEPRPPRPRWPALQAGESVRLRGALATLHELELEEDEEFAQREVIVTIGAAAAPKLLKALEGTEDEDLQERFADLLDRVSAAAHGPLIERELASRSWQVRRWALRRLMALDCTAALPRIVALLKKEKDASLKTTGEIALVRFGDLAGLPTIERVAVKNWTRWRDIAHPALTKVRGPEVTKRGLELLRSPDSRTQVAALRLLAGGGDKSAVAFVHPFLSSTDRQVQEAALNAMRAIVDGAPPMYDIPVFKLIELTSKWKGRR